MSPEFMLQLVLAFGSAAGVYAAIRSDLVTAKLTAEQAMRDADRARERIDAHLSGHG